MVGLAASKASKAAVAISEEAKGHGKGHGKGYGKGDERQNRG